MAQIEPSREFERALLLSLGEAVLVEKRDRIVLANQACLSLLGAPENAVLGRSVLSFFRTGKRVQPRLPVPDASGAPSEPMELRLVRPDGALIPVTVRSACFRSGDEDCRLLVLSDMSRRLEAEAAQRASDALYRQLFELSIQGVWIHSGGRILYANEAAAGIFGVRSPQDLAGRIIFDLVHPEDRPRAMARTEAAFEHGITAPFTEMKFLRDDGEAIVLEVRAMPIAYQGKPSMMVVARDVTERFEAAASLRESEARFRSLADTLPTLMWMSDAESNCVFVNKSWLDYTGRPLAAELGHGFADNMHPDDRGAMGEDEARMSRRQEPVSAEYRLRGRDGVYRWFMDHSVPRFADDGRYLGHVGVLIDIDHRRRLEARLKTIIETTVDGLITIDQKGTVLSFSGPAERMFGYAAEEVIGRDISMLMPEPYRSEHAGYIANYLKTGIPKVIGKGRQVEALRKDGTVFPMDLAIGELPAADGGREFVGTVRDVSESKRLEDQLRQAQKMEAIGLLTGGIAHDFNNLLGVVVGNLDILLDRAEPGSETHTLVNRALKGALHGAELTHRLLAFARKQALSPRPFNINELLPDVVTILRRTLGEGIRIKLNMASGLWPTYADPSQLQDALLNLAINARDAMPEGGTLTIETANAELDDSYARANPEVQPGPFAMLAITDTGTGMSPEVAKRAIEPFFTTKPPGQGTGLGLSMVYGFARQSGGHLKIYSEAGFGTSVKLYLPRAGGIPDAAATAAHELQSLPGGHETILVAEDNADLRQMVVEQLSSLGYRVVEAANGEQALAALTGSAADLLFTDIIMSGRMTGHDLAREARKIRPGLPILLTTGYAESGPGEGADTHFLRKPYRRRDLAFAVRRAIGRS